MKGLFLAIFMAIVVLASGQAAFADTSLRDRGIALFYNNDFKGARAALSLYIQRVHDDSLALAVLGHCKFKMGEREAALKDLGRAISLDPNLATAYNMRAAIWKQSETTERLADCGKLISLVNHPKTAEDYWFSARAKTFIASTIAPGYSQGEWYAQSNHDRRRYIQLMTKPESFVDYWRLGYSYHALGEEQNSVTAYTQALHICRDPYTLEARHYARLGLGDDKGAFEDLNLAIQLKPDAEFYIDRSDVRVCSKDYSNAAVDLNIAQKLSHPQTSDAQILSARRYCKWMAGDFSGSIDDCSALLSIQQNSDDYASRAWKYQYTGQYPKAMLDYNRAISLSKASNEKLLHERAHVRFMCLDVVGAVQDEFCAGLEASRPTYQNAFWNLIQ